jgi:hypothetical protein
MNCRHCSTPLKLQLLDLGTAPPSNRYLTREQLLAPESFYPLRVHVCTACWLVQTEDYAGREELFDPTYAYFSSTSSSWVEHGRQYANAMVVEVASNDGYLLQHFQTLGLQCLGIEPTASTASAARAKGLTVAEVFFGRETARDLLARHGAADLMAANNVLAHVPDINDFAAGFEVMLAERGVATFEFPHLLRLVDECQFDTVYHEHFSYLSLSAVNRVFSAAGLEIFDVERLTTHGGSLRVFAQRGSGLRRGVEAAVMDVLQQERKAGMETAAFYDDLQARAEAIKNALVGFLIEAKASGKRVGAYGAAAKGNTLLNFAGVRPDLLPWVVDRSPGKQGRFLPGSRIPITSEDRIRDERPDYLLLLPWNLRTELEAQLSYTRNWGCRFVTAVPRLEIR